MIDMASVILTVCTIICITCIAFLIYDIVTTVKSEKKAIENEKKLERLKESEVIQNQIQYLVERLDEFEKILNKTDKK